MCNNLYDSIRKIVEAMPEAIRNHMYLPPRTESLMDRFCWLLACGRMICPEYRFKWPQLDWWNKAEFTAYLNSFDEQQGMNSDRRWNLMQFTQLSDTVPGDTAECGCYRGASSYLICEANRRVSIKRMHHVFDSFEGLSEPSARDGSHWSKHSLSATQEELDANLRRFIGEYSVYKGWIPERFSEVEDRQFSFVHIDVDLHQPTSDSINFFYPRLNQGGVLICDDYGFTSCPGATEAIDTYMHGRPEPVIRLASGGCVIIKR